MLSLKTRRWIFIIFILFFFMLAPWLMLSVTGYRFDRYKNTFVKTGILSLKILTRDVQITLNREYVKPSSHDKNIFRFTSLLPNEYDVSISKTGYWTWKKHLRVESGRATFAYDIILFPKTTQKLLRKGQFSLADTASEQNLYIQKGGGSEQLVLLNKKSSQLETIFSTSPAPVLPRQRIVSAAWSPNQRFILVKFENPFAYVVLDAHTPNFQSIQTPLTETTLNYIFWSENEDYLIYAFTMDQLLEINLNTQKTRLLAFLPLTPNEHLLHETVVFNNTIWFFVQSPTETRLQKITFSEQDSITQSFLLLPSDSHPAFLKSQTRLPNFFDDPHGTIYLFHKEAPQNVSLLSGYHPSWKQGQEWLYHNQFEIWLWDENSNSERLVNRYGKAIQDVWWHPTASYVFFLQGGSLLVTEINTFDTVNTVELITMDSISSLEMDTRSDKLFFIGQRGEEQGLYEISLTQ